MGPILQNLMDALPSILWSSLWILGGIWMVQASFNIRRHEQVITGVTIGLAIETLLANMFSWIIPVPQSFWISAAAVFITGLGLILKKSGFRSLYQIPIYPGQLLLLLFLIYLFTGIGRGLAILDDYAHLPTLSLLASGEIPPRFALDPDITYGYHYFLMLFAAQLMRLADVFPWTALDIARGISFGLAIILAGVWTQRLTRSLLGGIYGSLMHMFAMGTRWLLLLLPAGILAVISREITMIGSGAASGPDLVTALLGSWAIEGAGPIPFPFAFANGNITPGVMRHAANGMISSAITLVILLTFNRWKSWPGAVILVLLIACSGLLGEVGLVLEIAGVGILILVYMLQHKTKNLPKSLKVWSLIFITGWLIALVQGGTITDLIRGISRETFLGEEFVSYQSVTFTPVWPPTIVSSHLGILEMDNPWHLLAAFLEIGPIILVLPLTLIWGLKAYRIGRWYEAVMMASVAISLVLFFVQFSGSSGVRNTTRLYSLIGKCWFWAPPLVWIWASHRSRVTRGIAAGLSVVVMLGGIVLLGVQLPAIQKPVYTYFIEELDAQVEKQYWDKLEKQVVIFDPTPSRAPVVFGRPTNSSISWHVSKESWELLYDKPDPVQLRQYGFDYAYLDSTYFEGLNPEYQELLQGPCVIPVEQITSKMGDQYRLLLDLRSCVE